MFVTNEHASAYSSGIILSFPSSSKANYLAFPLLALFYCGMLWAKFKCILS